jgi:ribosomal protein S18 acetylase RimI-like enzyme
LAARDHRQVARVPDPGQHDVVEPRIGAGRVLAREDPDRRAARLLRAAGGRGHDLAQPTADNRRPAFGQQPADLLGPLLVLRAASDHRDLERLRHEPMVEAAAMPTPELERALEFLALADHGGTREEPFAYGTAVFDQRLPRRWDSNFLLVERLPDGVSAVELAAEAERIQGAAGLRHRKLEVRDEVAGRRLEPEFRGLGWTVNRHVLMALHREPDRPEDATSVEEVDLDALREPRTEQLRSYAWAEDDVLAQLHEAKRLFAGRIETRFFAIVEAGRPVSWTDLYLAGDTAQIEDVGTLEAYRGRGYASAVILRASAEARRAGAELVFLVADDEDWPKELYRRLGFDELGRVYEFLLAKGV